MKKFNIALFWYTPGQWSGSDPREEIADHDSIQELIEAETAEEAVDLARYYLIDYGIEASYKEKYKDDYLLYAPHYDSDDIGAMSELEREEAIFCVKVIAEEIAEKI